jgi:dTDP-4-amino-4,6-dideoxygalactose transaminase
VTRSWSRLSFVASANCALYTGARPVFVDVDETGNMNPESLERTVKTCKRPRAVIVVHLYGLPATGSFAPTCRIR